MEWFEINTIDMVIYCIDVFHKAFNHNSTTWHKFRLIRDISVNLLMINSIIFMIPFTEMIMCLRDI